MRLVNRLTFLSLMVACGPAASDSTVVGTEASASWRTEQGDLRSGVAGPSIGLPVASMEDVLEIRDAFSLSAASPWGFEHHGIDFTPNPPTGTLMPVTAAEAGKVLFVDATLDGGHWRINVGIHHPPGFRTEYVLEPFSGSEADRDAQLALIAVAAGETVGRGKLIGRLRRVNHDSHLHFGIRRDNVDICPAPNFIPSARNQILEKLRVMYPGAELCYP